MNHEHHGHSHAETSSRLPLVLVLVSAYMIVEAVAGWLTNSLALLADAGHMLTDAGAIALAILAAWLARRPATEEKSYGYHRAEILAALANAVTLLLIVTGIVWEAYDRLRDPPSVMGLQMMLVATVGLAVNLVSAKLLHHKHDHDRSLNVEGVFWHIIGDALGSVGAIVAGILMWWKGWYWADPVVSLAIGVIILYGAVRLTRASVHVLMEGTPEHLDVGEVEDALEGIPGVSDVHDLHIWTVTNKREALSVHFVAADGTDSSAVLCEAHDLLRRRFRLDHATIQVEPPDFEHMECSFE